MSLIQKVGYSKQPLTIKLANSPNVEDDVYSFEITPFTDDMKFVLYAYPTEISRVYEYIQSTTSQQITVTVTHSYFDTIAQRTITNTQTLRYSIDANTPRDIYNVSSSYGFLIDYSETNRSDVLRPSLAEIRECFDTEIITTPTFDLSAYSKGKVNPLYTFIWSNLQNAVEGTNYYIEGQVKQPLIETQGFLMVDTQFETGSVTISYNDMEELTRANFAEIEAVFKLYTYDDRGIRTYLDTKSVICKKDGEMTSEDSEIHEDTSPTEDDNYDDASNTLIDPTGGSNTTLDNLMTSSYVVTPSQLLELKNFLWSADYKDNVLLLNNSPIENIISIKTLPFTVSSGNPKTIKVGNVSTGISANGTSTNHTFDLTGVAIPRKYNSFLDAEPYTSLSIYLPFIGVHDLPTNLLLGHTLNVSYKFDILTGAIVVVLKCDNTPFDFVMGNCGIDLPISAQNRTQVEIAQQRARVTGTANAINTTANAIGGIANTLKDIGKGDILGAVVSGSGVVGSLASGSASAYNSYLDYATATYHTTTKGVIGSQLSNYVSNECYLIIDRPVYSKPSTYAHDYGYPCELSLTLGNLSGFTQCSHSLELSGLPCTENEREDLRNLLTSGVYFTNENIDEYTTEIKNSNDVVFFKNSSDRLDTNKKLSTRFVYHNIKWKEDTNAMNPTFIVSKTEGWNGVNYLSTRIMGRTKFYYIRNLTLRKGGIMEIECEIDTLMTYNSYLRGIKTIVSRQENKNNKNLVDNNVAVPTTREIKTVSLGIVGEPNASIVLTVSN